MTTSAAFKPTKEEAWILLSYLFTKAEDANNPAGSIWSINYPPTQQPFNVSNAKNLTALLEKSLLDQIDAVEFDQSDNDLTQLNNGSSKAQVPIYEAVVATPSGDPEADAFENSKNQEELRRKFQGIVRNFLRTEKNPANQLAFLNKIQKQTKFNIFGHQGQRSKGSPAMNSLKYGYADLLRFLCEPVKSGEVARLTKANPIGDRYVVDHENGEYVRTYAGKYVKATADQLMTAKVKYSKEAATNPFYNPIQYDVPDERGNELLENLYVGARVYYKRKLSELAYLKKELLAKPSKERLKSVLENMLLIFRQIHDNRFDPIHLSKQIKGQNRPMETYKHEHFNELLQQMATRKALAPASVREKPSKTSNITLNVPLKLRESDGDKASNVLAAATARRKKSVSGARAQSKRTPRPSGSASSGPRRL